jgi:hypothetical protein
MSIDKNDLKKMHDALYNIIHSLDGLWAEIGLLANREEYLAEPDMVRRIEMRLDVIEARVGKTLNTVRLREMIGSVQM